MIFVVNYSLICVIKFSIIVINMWYVLSFLICKKCFFILNIKDVIFIDVEVVELLLSVFFGFV